MGRNGRADTPRALCRFSRAAAARRLARCTIARSTSIDYCASHNHFRYSLVYFLSFSFLPSRGGAVNAFRACAPRRVETTIRIRAAVCRWWPVRRGDFETEFPREHVLATSTITKRTLSFGSQSTSGWLRRVFYHNCVMTTLCTHVFMGIVSEMLLNSHRLRGNDRPTAVSIVIHVQC